MTPSSGIPSLEPACAKGLAKTNIQHGDYRGLVLPCQHHGVDSGFIAVSVKDCAPLPDANGHAAPRTFLMYSASNPRASVACTLELVPDE